MTAPGTPGPGRTRTEPTLPRARACWTLAAGVLALVLPTGCTAAREPARVPAGGPAPSAAPTPASPPGSPAPLPSTAPPALTAVPSRALPDPPPEPVGATAEPVRGLSVAVTALARVSTTATGPGQRAGAPGAAVTVRVVNTGTAPADLSTLLVDVATGPELRPATPSDGPGARALPAALAAGAGAQGTLVFEVPPGTRAVRVSVRLRGGTPAAVFDGQLP